MGRKRGTEEEKGGKGQSDEDMAMGKEGGEYPRTVKKSLECKVEIFSLIAYRLSLILMKIMIVLDNVRALLHFHSHCA